MNNKDWSDKILQKVDPSFRHRWEVYSERVKSYLDSNKTWLDCGCGNNGMVKSYGMFAKIAVGIDLLKVSGDDSYIKADIRKMPFPDEYANLITLRFVVEHFQYQDEYLDELFRVLKKGGNIILLTTSLLSPVIFIPKILPHSFRNKILSKLFRVSDSDIFPAYHKLNTPGSFKNLNKKFDVKEMIFLSDLNYQRRWIFILLLAWHKITSLKSLNKFRTNMLVILEKK